MLPINGEDFLPTHLQYFNAFVFPVINIKLGHHTLSHCTRRPSRRIALPCKIMSSVVAHRARFISSGFGRCKTLIQPCSAGFVLAGAAGGFPLAGILPLEGDPNSSS